MNGFDFCSFRTRFLLHTVYCHANVLQRNKSDKNSMKTENHINIRGVLHLNPIKLILLQIELIHLRLSQMDSKPTVKKSNYLKLNLELTRPLTAPKTSTISPNMQIENTELQFIHLSINLHAKGLFPINNSTLLKVNKFTAF